MTIDEHLDAVRSRSRANLLRAGLAEAQARGFMTMTRRAVATRAQAAVGLINHYWRTMDGFRAAVMEEAVRVRDLAVIRQGLAANHPAALAAPPDIRQAAVMS